MAPRKKERFDPELAAREITRLEGKAASHRSRADRMRAAGPSADAALEDSFASFYEQCVVSIRRAMDAANMAKLKKMGGKP